MKKHSSTFSTRRQMGCRLAGGPGVVLCGLLSVAVAVRAVGGELNRVLSPGDVGKPFVGLRGVDGRPYSLDAILHGSQGVVLIITSDRCPVARSYEDRLQSLARKYEERGIRFVAVTCEGRVENAAPARKIGGEERKFSFPYLHDPTQSVARAYGARVTPEVFVLRPDRTIAYLGAIDDAWDDADRVMRPYLREALDALLAGHAPKTTETRARGCAIDYR